MKRIRILFFAITLLFLSGCHGSREMKEFVVPEEFDISKSYEITFWAKNDTNKTQTAIYEQAIADFNKLYPNITINLRLYTDYGKIYKSRFRLLKASGSVRRPFRLPCRRRR